MFSAFDNYYDFEPWQTAIFQLICLEEIAYEWEEIIFLVSFLTTAMVKL